MGLKRNEQVLLDDYENWPLEVKQHVACKTRFSLDEEYVKTLYKEADTDEYNLRYGHIKTYMVSEQLDKDLKNKFSVFNDDLFHRFMFLVTEPNDIVPPHHDPRPAALYIPLIPTDSNYSPIEFYYKNKIYAINNTDKYRMWVINVSNLHAVFNNEFERFNLQCSLVKLPYEKFVKKYEEFMEF